MTKPSKGVLLLLALLAGVPLIACLPNQVGAMRLAGLSLLWWYGGVLAPIIGLVTAVVSLPAVASRSRRE